MAVSIEEMRAVIVQHYVGRGWSEESIRADDLPPEEVIRIYEIIIPNITFKSVVKII